MRYAHLLAAVPARWSSAVLAGVIAVLIAWLSLVQPGDVPAPGLSDKLQHVLAYAALSMPLVVAAGRPLWWVAVLTATLFGAGLEVAQATGDAGREGSIADGAANLIGALAGAGLMWRLLRPPR